MNPLEPIRDAENEVLFRQDDTVTYKTDDPNDESEWGVVVADQDPNEYIVLVHWNKYAEGTAHELAHTLQLVKPAPTNTGIVPPHILEKIEGHENDMVNHPPHYNQHPKGIECIDVIEDNPFILLGNAMKYLWRVSWGGKGNDTEDLEKAIWYIQRELKRRENAEPGA